MTKEFIPYELALELKELGFDEPCLAQWDEMELYPLQQGGESVYFETNKNSRLSFNTMAPTFSQAFRWFREKYKLDKTIDSWTEQPMDGEIWDKAYQYYINGESYHLYFKTYEEAELECLKKLIEIVKEK